MSYTHYYISDLQGNNTIHQKKHCAGVWGIVPCHDNASVCNFNYFPLLCHLVYASNILRGNSQVSRWGWYQPTVVPIGLIKMLLRQEQENISTVQSTWNPGSVHFPWELSHLCICDRLSRFKLMCLSCKHIRHNISLSCPWAFSYMCGEGLAHTYMYAHVLFSQ